LRKVLLDARKIVHSRPGETPAGNHLIEVFHDLGVTEEMKPKVVLHNVVDGGTELIIRGDVDFGLYPASAMIPIKGSAVAGLLPREVQRVTISGAGIMTDNPSPEPCLSIGR
jgi:ABC-type molybdate transport system substrate-binding protein